MRRKEKVKMQITKSQLLFTLTVAWGVLIFWLAPHPPMFDLPQHAGQIILLRDILLGQSPWADLFRINLFTPYLMGYGLALPLSLIMPIATALKLLLSLAYIAFVFMCVKLRQHFGADSRLDWLFLLTFFGFAYKWGFFTFLIAAPIGLWFILIADRYAQNQTFARALGVVTLGLILLTSHGLMFLFTLSTGLALLAARVRKFRALMAAILPFVILVLVCGGDFLINRKVNAGMGLSSVTTWSLGTSWLFGLDRLPKALLFSVSAGLKSLQGISFFVQGLTVVVLLCTPWLLGLRIDWKNRPSWIPFFMVALIIAIVPSSAFATQFLYERFALFLIPAYAWMFTQTSANESQLHVKSSLAAKLAVPLLVIMCWFSLTLHAVSAWKFGQETADFDAIISTLEPGHRALSLVFEPSSKADNNIKLYVNYPSWYQVEKQGLVDFNIAWFPPVIVRYKLEHLPAVAPGFEWNPWSFDWVKSRGSDYNYFFVRHSSAIPQDLFKGADCPPTLLVTRGMWTVFERTPCH